MRLAAGTFLGPYQIVAELGEGGMGEVYRARDPKLDRDVAIKVLPVRLAEHADALARFEREAKAVAALSHPNILAIYDFGRDGDAAYAVMELLDGKTLREALTAPLPARKAIDYGVQIARGLAAAHGKNIVHRDLKPANVFLTNDGRIKILDFGLARQTALFAGDDATATVERHTEPGTVLGTVGYMSPEQARGEPGDQRSDIFSLGAVLYELVSGRRAFQRDTAAETMAAILREDPPDLAAAPGAVPIGVVRVIQHCLEKNPVERFQSASDVAFALEALSLSGSSTSSALAADATAATLGRRRRGLIAVAIVTAAAFVTAGALLAGRLLATPSREIAFTPLTYRQQAIMRALFAPDGKTIVFSTVLSNNDDPELFTLSPDVAEPRSLGVRRVQLLSVSSKGELAVLTHAKYVGHRLFDGTLARMPIGGSAPREIVEHVREADWGPDGEQIAVIRDVNGRDRLEFPMGTVLYESGGYLSDVRVSPTGDRVAFFEHPIKFDDRGGVAVVDLARKKTTLAGGYWGLEGLAWARDGKEVLFAAGLGYAQFKVYGVTMDGRLRQALESAGGLTMHDIAADGRWLVTRDDIGAAMMVKSAGSMQEVDLSWLDFTTPVAFSSDGRFVLFSEQSGPVGVNYATGIRPIDGSPIVQLGEGFGTDLSLDDKWAVSIRPSAPATVTLYPTGPGQSRRLDLGQMESVDEATWFPDGKRLLLCGAEKGQAPRCYVQEVDGKPRPVTPDNVGDGLVAPDGRHFVARRGGVSSRVRSTSEPPQLYSIDGGAPRSIPGLTADDVPVRFAPDGRSLIVTQNTVPAPVSRVFLDTGRREPMYRITPVRTSGVVGISSLVVGNDPSAYAYGFYQFLSRLFVVQGAR